LVCCGGRVTRRHSDRPSRLQGQLPNSPCLSDGSGEAFCDPSTYIAVAPIGTAPHKRHASEALAANRPSTVQAG
jgi:hypothetical protein